MLNVIFLNDKKHVYNGVFTKVSDNVVSISGVPAIAGGFTLTRVGKGDNWDYSAYKTIYKQNEFDVQFSNDGSIYVEPKAAIAGTVNWMDANDEDGIRPEEVKVILSNGKYRMTNEANDWAFDFGEYPVDTDIKIESVEGIPEEYVVGIGKKSVTASLETIAQIQERKVAECSQMQQAAIEGGTNITLSDGTVEHFTMTAQDQSSLEGLALLVERGQEYIPWHTSDQAEHCKYYSNEDMNLIVQGAVGYVTYHVTYFRDLRIYIRSLTDREVLSEITYGAVIPAAYQSDVLKDLIAAMPVPEVVEPEENDSEVSEESTEE